jgi:sialic acid synthase SpsE
MKTNSKQRSVRIISEIHPQHHGSMSEIKRMVLQSKIGGADAVKVQLYSSKNIWGDESRDYISITKPELKEIDEYCKIIGIDLSASVFDYEKLDWCEEINLKFYKIASRTVKEDVDLCKRIIDLKKETIISLGMYDWKNGFPFEGSNIKYLYCVSNYPTQLTDLKFPEFSKNNFYGYSDHTIGISAPMFAVAKGALLIEKHFSNNKALQVETQLAHVCSMDLEDLTKLRNYSDAFTLIRNA